MDRDIPKFGPDTVIDDDDSPVTLPDGTVLDGDVADEYAERVKATSGTETSCRAASRSAAMGRTRPR